MEPLFHPRSRPRDMEAIVTLLIPVTFLLAFALERLFPARPLPKVKWWVLKGFVFFFITGTINALVPALVTTVVGPHAPVHSDGWSMLLSVPLLVASAEILAYFVHRGMHNVHFVWRWTHQMHHSAERMDIPGAAYFHPFDIALQAGIGSLAPALLGASADAAALAGFIGFAAAMFQHMNVRTPQWLGYVIQRPEMHSVHHARGVHAYNYGNFSFMDLLFGTFRNPKDFSAEAGFWDGASKKLGAMLLGRDVGAA